LDAAKLANLNVLSLINQPSAIALTYGIERTFNPESPEYVMFLDVGATDVEISVYKFSSVQGTVLLVDNSGDGGGY